MVSKSQMNILIVVLLIATVSLSYIFVIQNQEPPVDPETKYVCTLDPEFYIVLNASSHEAFMHGDVTNYRGDYVDRDGEITIFPEVGKSAVFKKYDNGSLGLKLDDDEPVIFKRED